MPVKKNCTLYYGAAGYYGGLLAAAARAPKLVRSCTFRVAQLPKLLEIALGFLRQEVAIINCGRDGPVHGRAPVFGDARQAELANNSP